MLNYDIQRAFQSDFARFFSASVLRDIARRGHSSYVESVLRSNSQDSCTPVAASDLFESVFGFLSKEYRCEYIFKNALALRHAGDSAIYSELRVGGRVADMVIFNDTSTVYEIKTGLDRLDRLSDQLNTFMKVFYYVYAVTETAQISEVVPLLPESVGLISMDQSGNLIEHKASQSHSHLFDPTIAFDILRKAEYQREIATEYGFSPVAAQWDLYYEYKRLFCELEPLKAVRIFERILTSRRAPETRPISLEMLPASLTAATFSCRLSAKEWQALPDALAGYEVSF